MFVIASLIDKLPNLGGIARTCEVLGIRNLVMNCKRDIEKKDFKNLRQVHIKRFNIHLHTYWNMFVTIDPNILDTTIFIIVCKLTGNSTKITFYLFRIF